MSLRDVISKGLPTLHIETVNGEEPTCDYVSAPTGCNGRSITNVTKVPGRLVLYQYIDGIDSVLYDSGDYEKDISGMTIKIRGNGSAYTAKKPYKIKLQKKQDLLFRGDEAKYKDKDWLLLKYDYLLTTAAFKVNELLNLPWTPGCHHVNVILNGSFKGIYMLTESVKRNPDCRLNVDKLSGYIFECDAYWWNEPVYVNSITSPKYNFTFKYPDSDDILPEQLEYIQGVVTRYENSLTTDEYPELIDVRSFAAWCLGHDILGSDDAGGANRYYTKYDSTDTSKIFMCLLWDFDMTERTSYTWSTSHIKHFTKIFDNPNKTFVDEYVGLWREVEGTIYTNMMSYLNQFTNSAEGKALNNSLKDLESVLWNYQMASVASNVTDRISWYNPRIRWMKNKVPALNPVGDVNIDGNVDIWDLSALIDMLLGKGTLYRNAADVDKNGQYNIDDLTILVDMLISGV